MSKKLPWLIIIISLLALAIIALVAFMFLDTSKSSEIADGPKQSLRQSLHSVVKKDKGCESEPTPRFTHFVTDLEDVTNITPPLMRVSGDVKTHSYLNVEKRVAIYAPVDATLVSGAKYQDDNRVGLDQYSLNFDVSCEVYFYFDHLIDPIAEIAKEFPDPAKYNNTRSDGIGPIEIKAGQLLGYSPENGPHNWDFGVINKTATTVLANDPEFNHSEKYGHAVCPYAYFSEEIQAQVKPLYSYENHSDLQIIDNLCD